MSANHVALTPEDAAIFIGRTTLRERLQYRDAHDADYTEMWACRCNAEAEHKARMRRRDAVFFQQFTRAALLVLIILAFPYLGGCASTNTVLRIGLHADVTDYTSGCVRNADPGCGLRGPREIAKIELMWAPSVRPGPYCSISDDSHYSAGVPFNNKFEGFVHTVGCGGFFQFGGAR